MTALQRRKDGDRGSAEEQEKKGKERERKENNPSSERDGRERTFFLRFQTYYYCIFPCRPGLVTWRFDIDNHLRLLFLVSCWNPTRKIAQRGVISCRTLQDPSQPLHSIYMAPLRDSELDVYIT